MKREVFEHILKSNQAVITLEANGYEYLGCANHDFKKVYIKKSSTGERFEFKNAIEAVDNLIKL